MDRIAALAASGLRAKMEALDLLANNLANTSTIGYKGDQEFNGLFIGAQDGVLPSQLPVVERQWTRFSPGQLQPTGNPLDLALGGSGFFAVAGPTGPLYTRNGAFRLSAQGLIVNGDGYEVKSAGGAKIQATPGIPLSIESDGTVRQEGADLGKIAVFDFSDPSTLAKSGHVYFRSPESTPATVANPEVLSGRLEGSNVNAAEAAVRLVSVMRQFETLQKAISVSADMNRKATDEVGRVGS
jgi:flagellar basal-body rod protein FlgF